MLSEKLTLSLTCLVVLLAVGLVFTPSVMADHGHFGLSITAAETMVDVSSDDGMQIASGRDRSATRALDDATDRAATLITLLLKSDQIVNLSTPTGDLVGRGPALVEVADRVLDATDLRIDAYDAEGRALGILPLTEADDVVVISHRDPTNPGKEFLIRVDEQELTNAYTAARAGGLPFEIHTLLFSIPRFKMERADEAYITAIRNDAEGDHAISQNNAVGVYKVQLVDNDEGAAAYATNLAGTAATAGVPGVVAIQSLRERAGFIETGPFTVRVILTEEPMGGFKTDHVAVKNGSATAVAKGATLKGAHVEVDDLREAQTSELTAAVIPSYAQSISGGADLPAATGRDNKYHQYFVTITPNVGLTDADVVVSVKQFDDKVIPVPNRYVPLSDNQILATTLTPEQNTVRDARVMNETLTVKATTAAAAKTDATVAYEKRKTDVFDKVHNEIVLGAKTYIPAGGYLVIVVDRGKATIIDPKVTTKDKVTEAQEAFNVFDPGDNLLPFPADDLDNFFRNGGTLNLAYADIPEATGSDHADAKGATGDDATGYDKANSTAYAAGALIFNEIMWGLDAGAKDSQYIELHNPGTTAIGIDRDEWVITVENEPSGFTVIDTVSNNPASGFWEVPGSGGRTVPGDTGLPVTDLVSMSRVTGSADGTAAASWVASERPSKNLSGRRIGTPGFANNYMMPAVVTPPVVTTPPVVAPTPVAVAGAADIAISEVMYSTGRGNLPQWIELHNMSASEVSLEGWNVEIENDGGSDLTITLGAITVGVGEKGSQGGQAVLLVSKNGRNSGMGDEEGDLRRVVNLKDLGVTGTLLSSTGFTITLSPPPAAGSSVRTDGDVAGGMDWDLPMMDDDRSSLIREKDADGTYKDGSMRMSWHPTSSTGRYGTYYGHPSDMGTPGYVKGGALPVELSMFYPARDKLTGQVVITWETQSELNNAGFYIKRSEQPNGTFVVINPTMIPGAGTTAEKQSYTHTDTTAKPNVLYYYQIEDVSLDGKRATLTGAHRLRGHIGAAGKVTTIWGELKAQE